jgi:hypothetical protein
LRRHIIEVEAERHAAALVGALDVAVVAVLIEWQATGRAQHQSVDPVVAGNRCRLLRRGRGYVREARRAGTQRLRALPSFAEIEEERRADEEVRAKSD